MSDVLSRPYRRFENLRPGLTLMAVEDAALPVAGVQVDVLAQEKKQLPITEEFVLRFSELGVDTPARLASYLGLQESQMIEAAVSQVSLGNLVREKTGRLRLTAQGKEAARELASLQPILQSLPVSFDRLAWAPADFPTRGMLSKREAIELGYMVLPALKSATIGLPDITPAALNVLLGNERVQVLRVDRVARSKFRFLPVKLLVYGDEARGELELALCVEDQVSTVHGDALLQLDAVSRLNLRIAQTDAHSVPTADIELRRSGETGDQVARSSEGAISEPQLDVRGVTVYEHPGLLHQALTTARERLLLISPWVKSAVVNSAFLRMLEGRLKAGVTVTFAHGIGDDDKGSDERALADLTKLARKYKNFDLIRARNTHAKVLIFDNHWVNSSFNWLSFRGDPDRTYRMEEGTIVSVPALVASEYGRLILRLDEQRVT